MFQTAILVNDVFELDTTITSDPNFVIYDHSKLCEAYNLVMQIINYPTNHICNLHAKLNALNCPNSPAPSTHPQPPHNQLILNLVSSYINAFLENDTQEFIQELTNITNQYLLALSTNSDFMKYDISKRFAWKLALTVINPSSSDSPATASATLPTLYPSLNVLNTHLPASNLLKASPVSRAVIS